LSSNRFSGLSLRARARGTQAAIVAIALVGALAVQAAPAPAAGSCTSPPAVYPIDAVHKGLTATGSTVIDGQTITSFDVTVLGVQPNGIGPGVDFILGQITGPQSFLDVTGGIVAGMSGSPIYVSGELLGAASYGFYAADQTIIGITPGQPIVDEFAYPSAPTGTDRPGAAALQRERLSTLGAPVHLSRSLRSTAAHAAGVPADTFPSTAQPVPVSVGVSGLGGKGMAKLQNRLSKAKVTAVLFSGGTASAPTSVGGSPLAPGSSFGAALSYGDLSIYAVGTTTAVCGDEVMAFGHPFFFTGGTTLGMNGADVVATVKDPSSSYGGFKIANLTGLRGIVDQDRVAGVRGLDGRIPALVPVTANITNTDIPKTRNGETDVLQDLEVGNFYIDFPIIAAYSIANEEIAAFDRYGDGSANLSWTVSGVGPDGQQFQLIRDDKFFSPYDITFESIFELIGELDALQYSQFGEVQFTGVSVTGTLTQDHDYYSVDKVLSSSSLQRGFDSRKRLQVRPGGTVHLRVVLGVGDTDETRTVNMSFKVPDGLVGGASLDVRGGFPPFCGGFFFFRPADSRSACKATTFEELVANLAGGEHMYDLVAEIRGQGGVTAGPKPGGEAPARGGRNRIDVTVTKSQDQTVQGRRGLQLIVVPGRHR